VVRFLVASAIVIIFVSLLIAGTPGSPGDTTADIVLGQDDFTHNVPNLVDAKGIDLRGTGLFGDEAWTAIDTSGANAPSLCFRLQQQPRPGLE